MIIMYKQAIVVRTDLQMNKGKLAVQTSHASLLAYKLVKDSLPDIANAWFAEGQKKVVLKVSGQSELLDYFKKIRERGIPCELVRDAGRTQLAPGTITCFGAGPWDEKELDEVLGKLKLL